MRTFVGIKLGRKSIFLSKIHRTARKSHWHTSTGVKAMPGWMYAPSWLDSEMLGHLCARRKKSQKAIWKSKFCNKMLWSTKVQNLSCGNIFWSSELCRDLVCNCDEKTGRLLTSLHENFYFSFCVVAHFPYLFNKVLEKQQQRNDCNTCNNTGNDNNNNNCNNMQHWHHYQ